MPQGAAYGSQANGTGSYSGGRGSGAADAGKAAAAAQQAKENAIMGMGGAVAGPAPSGPSPTFTHNQGVQGPRPGTGDRWGTTVGQQPDIQAQQTDYNNAADAMQNRGFGGWLGDNALDLIPGFHQTTPQWNQPSTFANGTYHDAWAPVAAALGLAGMAAPVPGASTVASKVGLAATKGLGLPDYQFGGGGWNPDQSNAIEKAFGPATNPYGPPDPTRQPNLGNPTQGGQRPQIAGPGTGVSIFNPQPPQMPGQPPVQPPAVPPIFGPPVQSRYNVPGGLPYGIDLFRRAA